MSMDTKVESLIKSRIEFDNTLRKNFKKLWEEAENFSELLLLNKKFLLGKIPETPYSVGSIDDETKPLVESLLRLHQLQLLIDGSQSYLHEFVQRGEKWVECQQRPFISFTVSVLYNKPKRLLALFKCRSDIVVRASNLYSRKTLRNSDKKVAVSRAREANNFNDLREQAWENYTASLDRFDYSEDFFCLKAMKQSQSVVFNVAARTWGENLNLLKIVEKTVIEYLETI